MDKLIKAKDHDSLIKSRKWDFTEEERGSMCLSVLSYSEIFKIVGPLRIFWWFAYLPYEDRGILILKMLRRLIDSQEPKEIECSETMVLYGLDRQTIIPEQVYSLIRRLEVIASRTGVQASPPIVVKFRVIHAFLAAAKCVLDQHFLYSVALNFGEVFGEIDKPQFEYYPEKLELNKIVWSFLEAPDNE